MIPSIIWTWVNSGSPFGTVGQSIFSSSNIPNDLLLRNLIFDIKSYNVSQSDPFLRGFLGLEGYRDILNETFHAVIMWSPLIFISLFYIIKSTFNKRFESIFVMSLIIFQSIIIYYFLPHKIRHFGGLQYLPIIILFIYYYVELRIIKKLYKIIIGIFILPWILIQSVYAAPLVEVNFNMIKKENYYQKYIAFFNDYKFLDKNTNLSSEFLVVGTRINAFYSPRKVLFNSNDFNEKENKKLYLFLVRDNLFDTDVGAEYQISLEKLNY